jgi:hypothetical protein
MRDDLRQICSREIERINKISQQEPLGRDDIEKLKNLASALKTLEDSKTPDTDNITDAMSIASIGDILKVLDDTEDDI